MPVYPMRVTWRDWRGDIARTSYYISATTPGNANALGATWVGVLTTKSRAAIQSVRGAFTSQPIPPTYGVNTQRYPTVEDRAECFFKLGGGGIYRMEIPAPNDQFFLADQETVDIANAAVINLANNVVTCQLCTREGELIGAIIGGIHRRRKVTHQLTGLRRFA